MVGCAHRDDVAQASISTVDNWQGWYNKASHSTHAPNIANPWHANKATVFSYSHSFLQRCRLVCTLILFDVEYKTLLTICDVVLHIALLISKTGHMACVYPQSNTIDASHQHSRETRM